jgi:hypothetical protein
MSSLGSQEVRSETYHREDKAILIIFESRNAGDRLKSAEANSSWGCLGKKAPSTTPGMVLKG